MRDDFLSGARSGVNGTRTFFIDEVRYGGPHDFEAMLEALEYVAELKEKSKR